MKRAWFILILVLAFGVSMPLSAYAAPYGADYFFDGPGTISFAGSNSPLIGNPCRIEPTSNYVWANLTPTNLLYFTETSIFSLSESPSFETGPFIGSEDGVYHFGAGGFIKVDSCLIDCVFDDAVVYPNRGETFDCGWYSELVANIHGTWSDGIVLSGTLVFDFEGCGTTPGPFSGINGGGMLLLTPVPPSILLLGSGLAGLFGFQCRKYFLRT